MDTFIKQFKNRFIDTYPVQKGSLFTLGLCGTFSDGVFRSDDVHIKNKIKLDFTYPEEPKVDKLEESVEEFYSIMEPKVLTETELKSRGIIVPVKFGVNAKLKLLNFETKDEFYYRAILTDREYIYDPIGLFKNSILTAMEKGYWKENDVVITSILWGKNPTFLKSTAKGRCIIGGEISAKLSLTENIFAEPNFKIEISQKDSSIYSSCASDPNERV